MTLVQDRCDTPVFETFGPLPRQSAIWIGEEQVSDVAPREALLDAAFGRKERFAKTCQKIREGRLPARGLSLVAREGAAVIGTVRLWHVNAGGVPALLLGPLAVSSAHRSLGLGSKLMAESLRRVATAGHRAVILVGDAAYYEKFGFSREVTRALAMPGPIEDARFLGLELQAHALGSARGLVVPTGAIDLDWHRGLQEYATAA